MAGSDGGPSGIASHLAVEFVFVELHFGSFPRIGSISACIEDTEFMNIAWQQVTPVLISMTIIVAIAVLRNYSTTIAAITATMPIMVPLSMWILYSGVGGDQAVTIQFIQAMVLGVTATLISVVTMLFVARSGWGIIGIIGACYGAWAVVLGTYFVFRRILM